MSGLGLRAAKQLLERLIVLSAAAAIAAFPTKAAPQSLANSLPAPVSITTCSVDTSYVTGNPFYGPAQQSEGGNVRLGFVNTNNVIALSVHFSVTEGAYKQHIIVNGRFAHGVTIERAFQEDSASGSQNAKCSIEEIHFADGTAWSAAGGVAPQ